MSWLTNVRAAPQRAGADAQAVDERTDTSPEAGDEFAAAVAHDLKAPLAAISMMAQLARRRLERLELESAMGANLAGNLADIETNARRMARQLDELLDVAHLQAGKPPKLNLARTSLLAIVDAALAANEARDDRHAIRVIARADPQGTWDAARLTGIVDKLISNAIKYSPAESEITLDLNVEREADGREMATLCVEDQGVPLSHADVRRIFERFFRDRAGGSGRAMGLAGARQIVQQHGGTLDAESKPGAGTTFRLRLPLGGLEEPARRT